MVRMHPETLKITAHEQDGRRGGESLDGGHRGAAHRDDRCRRLRQTLMKNLDAVRRLVAVIERSLPGRSWFGPGGPWPVMARCRQEVRCRVPRMTTSHSSPTPCSPTTSYRRT